MCVIVLPLVKVGKVSSCESSAVFIVLSSEEEIRRSQRDKMLNLVNAGDGLSRKLLGHFLHIQYLK